MFTKNLFKISVLVVALLLTLGTSAFAQATLYVNNNGGVDTRTGQNDNVGDNTNGPVGTITRAIALATDGSTISVAYTGNDYLEPGAPAGVALITKTVTLVSTGSGANALVINNLTMNGASKTATFSTLFKITGTLYLQNGTIAGGTNVALGAGALIQQLGGSLAAAPTFGTAVNLQYDATATIGTEFPTDATVANNLNVTAGTLTLNRAVTINGALTATGAVVLGANNLTLASTAAVAHVLDGAITSTTGEIIFSLGSGSGTYTVDLDRSGAGNIDIPGFRVQGAARVVRFANANANGTFTVTGNVTNESPATLTLSATPALLTRIKGTLINSNSGVITVGTGGNVQVDGNVINSGNFAVDNTLGIINFSNTGTLALKADLTNMAVITGSIATATTKTVVGKIAITSGGAITISGNVTNQSDIQVSNVGTGNLNDAGNITFPDIAVTVTGLTSNVSTRSAGTLVSTGTFTNNGCITFGNTITGNGNDTFTGGLTNSSSGFATNVTASGRIQWTGRSTSTITVGTSTVLKDVVNSSSNSASTNGDIDFTATATGSVTINGALSLAGASGTGKIIFGLESVTAKSVSITRSVTGANITIAADGGAAYPHNFGAFSMSAANAAFTIGALTNAGSTIAMSSFTITNGTATFGGGASISPITVSGNVSAIGGTLDVGTAVRNLNFNGADVNVNGVVFSNAASTTLIFGRSSSPQTFTSGVSTTWPGNFTVSNGYVLAPTFTFVAGNFTVAGTVTFTDNTNTTDGVNIANGRLILTKSGLAFNNAEGYTATSGVVSLQGGAAQIVKGTGDFAAIECNNAAGLTFGDGASGNVTHPITGTLYLTLGTVTTDATGGNVSTIGFVNSTTPPTIIRSAGALAGGAAMTFTNAVNVTYTGTAAIATGVELGGAADVNNLTVATAGGNQTVTLGASEQVNGTLTVNAGQTLALAANTLTINGASVVNNGTITNTTGVFTFNKSGGTTVTGAGSLPDVNVVTTSSGNVINGATGLTKNAGAVGTGNLTLTGAGTISVSFTGTAIQVNAITTGTGSTLTLAANLKSGGNIGIGAGTLALSTYNLTFQGGAVVIDVNATVSGTGALIANGQAVDQTLDLSAAGSVTIPNLTVNNSSVANKLTVLTTGTTITVSGALNVTKGDLSIAGGTLKVTGPVINLPEGSSDILGAGLLDLAPASSGTVTLTLKGAARTIPNMQIDGNVTLATAVESPALSPSVLTVTALNQTAGLLDNGGWDVATPAFTRTGGTYQGAGYLEITANSFAQGTGFSIPNLKISAAVTVADVAFTVTNNLYLNAATLTTKPGTTGRLTLGVAAGTVPTVTIAGAGNLDVAPTFGQGTSNYVFTGTAATTVNATSYYWLGANTAVAMDVTDSQTGGGTLAFATGRTINGNLKLISNVLSINAATTLTLATSGATISRTELGSISLVNATTSILSAANVNLHYLPSDPTNPTGAITVGPEYIVPTVVNNVTVDPKITLTITGTGSARTIAGNLVANYDVIVLTSTTVTGSITVAASQSLTVTSPAVLTVNGTNTISGALAGNGAANFTGNVTFGAFTSTGTLGFVGTTGQTITLPSAGATMTNMTINMTGTNPVLNVAGGNLTVSTLLTFTNGILNMGSNTLTLGTNQGYAGASQTTGYVVGNVARSLAASFTGRAEFPVGTLTSYRSVAFTFLSASPVTSTTTITVSASDVNPYSPTGFPVTYAGITVDTTAGFAWQITSSTSLGPSQTFDIEFTGTGFLAANYPNGSVSNLRILSRLGNVITNPWFVQAGTYQNFEAAASLPIARVTSTTGGNLITQGATFTLGFKRLITNHIVSGKVSYANTAVTPIGSATVTLTGTALTATSSATDGTFSIANVPAGTYTLTASKTGNWGGVNAGDALIIANYTVGNTTLTALPTLAADVNASGSINAGDALQVLLRVVGNITTFGAGDWVFNSQSVTVGTSDLTGQIISGLCVGDVNASYTTTGTAFAKSAPISLKNGTDKFSISASSSAALGAVTMKINLNSAKVASVSSKLPGLVSHVDNAGVSVAWYAQDGKPIQFNANEAIVTVTLADKASDQSSVTVESELADINGATVNSSAAIAIKEIPTVFELSQNYPNPFNPSTQINYNLPQSGVVTLSVYNLLGQEVASLVNEQKEAGTYTVQWAPKNLASGVYVYRLHVQTEKDSFTSVKRLTLLK